MGFKNNTIEYGFGQMGSILITGTANAVTCRDVANSTFKTQNAVFVAIQFLEDTVFDSAGLTSEDDTIFVNDSTASTGIDANGGAVTGSEVFPKGLTIYGRWTSILLDSGKVIAYIGY
tara:strand:- start:1045 stop:1398 length:354 start_codon:yes stop_codon:yes gene_type:complete